MIRRLLCALAVVSVIAIAVAQIETPRTTPIPAAQDDATMAAKHGKATAVFAGGCFWGTQAVFERVKGVISTAAGYSGGSAGTANYADVSAETTDHAESVEVVYDPSRLTYGQLLRVFFTIHDPTTLNRQGPDSGTSYRSAIFYANDDQKGVAAAYIKQLTDDHAFTDPIVTSLEPLHGFYPAEDYHQDFAVLHPSYPYIVYNDAPKVENLKRLFTAEYRDMPVTVMASSKPTQ